MEKDGHSNQSSPCSLNQVGRRDRDRDVLLELAKEHVITAALLIWFFLGMAIIFADLWIPIIPYIHYTMEVVGDPVLFMLSLTMFFSILWNISFYLKRRNELKVARKLIRWVANQRSVVPRKERERERIDRVLKTSIWSLRNGEDVQAIIDALIGGTRDGEALPEGWARSHYEVAIEYLTDAAGRNQMLAWEERERDIQVGEKMLLATRAESLCQSMEEDGNFKVTW